MNLRANVLDILIPVYNSLERLKKTLDSIFLHCTPESVRIIVVDNASEADVFRLVARYHSVIYKRNEENIGRIGNWNKCLDYIESQYFMFIMAGDELIANPTEFIRLNSHDDAYVFQMLFSSDGNVRHLNKWKIVSRRTVQAKRLISSPIYHALAPWGPLQTWVFSSKYKPIFESVSESHADISFIFNYLNHVEKIDLVDVPIIRWNMSSDRFHNKINLVESRVMDHKLARAQLTATAGPSKKWIYECLYWLICLLQARRYGAAGLKSLYKSSLKIK